MALDEATSSSSGDDSEYDEPGSASSYHRCKHCSVSFGSAALLKRHLNSCTALRSAGVMEGAGHSSLAGGLSIAGFPCERCNRTFDTDSRFT